MRQLTLDDLVLGLKDLLGPKRALFESTRAWGTYGAPLQEVLAAAQGIPQALDARPLARELAEADNLHDRYGSAVYEMTGVYIDHPGIAPELTEAAGRIRAAFVPTRGHLTMPYADEVAWAEERRPDLARLEADLASIPVGTAKTLYDWVQAFLDHGRKIGELLNRRSDAQAQGPLPDGERTAAMLRSDIRALLGELRKVIQREVRASSALPRDLETQLFGTLDEVLQTREGQQPA